MIIGNNFAIVKGYLQFDPRIQQGDNGSYTYITLNQLRYKQKDGTKVYQKVQCQFNGAVVDAVVAKFFKKGTYVQLYGEWVITYEKNDQGYDDTNKPKSAIFKVGEVGYFNTSQGNQNQSDNNQNNNQSSNQGYNQNQSYNQSQAQNQGYNQSQGQNQNYNQNMNTQTIDISDDDLPF